MRVQNQRRTVRNAAISTLCAFLLAACGASTESMVTSAKEYIANAFDAVAPSTELLRSRTSTYEDTAIMDFINHVQQETVRAAIKGGEFADLPVLSVAAPLTRTGVFPNGMVTTGHIGNLYLYPNTLNAVELSGSQLRDYLE